MKKTNGYAFVLLLILWSTVNAASPLSLPRIFSSNMVLQREMLIPVWGQAEANAPVKISLAGHVCTTIAGEQGDWQVRLPQMPAGGPHELSVQSGDAVITFTNVMVGDVWIASGQSNMQFSVSGVLNSENEISAADSPSIRLFTVPLAVAGVPEQDLSDGEWVVCSPQTVPDFSAVAYFFGRDLHQHLNVPIGLINTSWGGTPAEAWTSAEMLKTMPSFQQAAEKVLVEHPDYKLLNATQKPLDDLYNKLLKEADQGVRRKVHHLKFDDSQWKKMSIPGYWENNGLPGFDGFVWYRKIIRLPKEIKGKPLELHLGKVSQIDITYFNGQEIGRTSSEQKYRSYLIPDNLSKPGENIIAVRVTNRWGNGGIFGAPDSLYIVDRTSRRRIVELAGDWRFDEQSEPALPRRIGYQNYPTALFNAMIAPLIPYGIKGAIWYQGEANAGRAFEYRTLLPKMIEDWRVRWGQGYFPFFIVQLANFTESLSAPAESDWAELREAQLKTLVYPNTGMAVTIDIGEADDIHPRNKQDVGGRLALAARKTAYGEELVFSGPLFQSMETDGGKIVLTFTHVGSGLMLKGDRLEGFAIAGPDKKFVWADAVISADKIIVSSPLVAGP
ncbi:MAG: 9-O-acetylesterase, partial [Calditrichaeota bacterium]